MPLRFIETMSTSLHSPHMLVQDSSCWRGALQRKQYAVAAGAHTYWDVSVELLLEVRRGPGLREGHQGTHLVGAPAGR